MALRRSTKTDTAEANEAAQEAAPAFAEGAEAPAAEAAKEEAPAPAEAVAQPPAPAPASSVPAAPSGQHANASLDALASQGYDGLELGFGAFPIIVLSNKGVFETSDGEVIGDEFRAVVLETKSKFVLKNTKCDKKEEEVFYSYDKETTTEGEPIEDIIADWEQKGWGFELKKYIEGVVERKDAEDDGSVYLISIPPTSLRRFSGYVLTVGRRTGLLPNQFITRFYVGEEVTSAQHPFYPWAFEYVGPVE